MILNTCLLTLVAAGFILRMGGASLPLNTSEVSGYQKLKSWKNSTLFRVQTNASGYTYDPLLIHLVGARYGKNTLG